MKKYIAGILVGFLIFSGAGLENVRKAEAATVQISAAELNLKIKKDFFYLKTTAAIKTINKDTLPTSKIVNTYQTYRANFEGENMTEEAKSYVIGVLNKDSNALGIIHKKTNIDVHKEYQKIWNIYNDKKTNEKSKVKKLNEASLKVYDELEKWNSSVLLIAENSNYLFNLSQLANYNEPLEKQHAVLLKEYSSALLLQTLHKKVTSYIDNTNKKVKTKYNMLSKKYKNNKAVMIKLNFLNHELIKVNKKVKKYRFGVRSIDGMNIDDYVLKTADLGDATNKLQDMNIVYRSALKNLFLLNVDLVSVQSDLNRMK